MCRGAASPTFSRSRRARDEGAQGMTDVSWRELSQQASALVNQAAASVVRVDGGGRTSSSGIVWAADGTVVSASHGLEEDEVEIGLPSGEDVAGEVVGRDPSTDLAVVRAKIGELP